MGNDTEIPTRDGYGHALLELMEHDKNIIVLDADLSRSTRTNWVEERYPEQFINVGIAEQNLIGVASGLALEGLIPFATTYSIFIGRAFDQIRQSVSFASANVKIVATHAGLAASHDGGSHQGIEDIALIRCLPNFTIISPCDYYETKKAIIAAAYHVGPVYIRLQKEASPIITSEEDEFRIGQLKVFRPGTDIVIFATGTVCADAILAAKILDGFGISVCVINVSTIKPIHESEIRDICERYKAVAVAEEHSYFGGLFESICSANSIGHKCPIWAVNIRDEFGESGEWHELKEKFNLTSSSMAKFILNKYQTLIG